MSKRLKREGTVVRDAYVFFFSSRRRHTRFDCDWSSDVCSSDLLRYTAASRSWSRTPSRARTSERVWAGAAMIGGSWKLRGPTCPTAGDREWTISDRKSVV